MLNIFFSIKTEIICSFDLKLTLYTRHQYLTFTISHLVIHIFLPQKLYIIASLRRQIFNA